MWIVIARVVFVIVAAMLLFAAGDAILVGRRLSSGVRTEGEVVSVSTEQWPVTHASEMGDTVGEAALHTATVRFSDEDGRVHDVTAKSSTRDFRQTKRLPVVYLRDAPEAAQVLAHGSPWDRPLSIAGVAAMFGAFGALAYCLGRAQAAAEESRRPPGLSPGRP